MGASFLDVGSGKTKEVDLTVGDKSQANGDIDIDQFKVE